MVLIAGCSTASHRCKDTQHNEGQTDVLLCLPHRMRSCRRQAAAAAAAPRRRRLVPRQLP